jgi:antitoxin (DNA-binding transcriptional repressor) of toxin-antitoxin stability system
MTMEVSIDPLHTNQSLLISLVNVGVAFIITGHT